MSNMKIHGPTPVASGTVGLLGNYLIYKISSTYYAYKVSDGTITSNSNATTLIQNTINSLGTSGTIVFKVGIYSLPTGLTVTNAISLIGESGEYNETHSAGVILQASIAQENLLTITMDHTNQMDTGPLIQNIVIDGNDLANVGLYITDAVRLKCWNVHIHKCLVWGLKDFFNHSHDFTDCTFAYNGANGTDFSGGCLIGNSNDAGSPVNAIRFDRCNWEANRQVGIYLAHGTGMMFYNCVIESSYSYGLYAYVGNYGPLQSLSFYGCYWEQNNIEGVARPANFMMNEASWCTFMDNYFYEISANTTYSLTVNSPYTTLINMNPEYGVSPNIFYSDGIGVTVIGDTRSYTHS